MNPLVLKHFTATSCVGRGIDATLAALRQQHGGLVPCAFEGAVLDSWAGVVEGVDDIPVRADLRDFECRNNRLAQLGLMQDGFTEAVEQAIARHGAGRVGVFMGTSTVNLLTPVGAFDRTQSIKQDVDMFSVRLRVMYLY